MKKSLFLLTLKNNIRGFANKIKFLMYLFDCIYSERFIFICIFQQKQKAALTTSYLVIVPVHWCRGRSVLHTSRRHWCGGRSVLHTSRRIIINVSWLITQLWSFQWGIYTKYTECTLLDCKTHSLGHWHFLWWPIRFRFQTWRVYCHVHL